MAKAITYEPEFYDRCTSPSLASARVVLGHLWQYYAAQSVVDVGCGRGTWLKAAEELKVARKLGLEGAWLKREDALIPGDEIKTANLAEPFALPETYDLAISMEVAEHLPPARAEGFVKDLTRLAKVILFSAAVPGQGGTHHVNEQWPRYWTQLFAQEGYLTFDCIRSAIWTKPEIRWWYAQNSFLFVEASFLQQTEKLQALLPFQVAEPLSLIHPGMVEAINRPNVSRVLFELLPGSIARAFARRLGK